MSPQLMHAAHCAAPPGHQRLQLHRLPEPPPAHHVPDRSRGAGLRPHGEAVPHSPPPPALHPGLSTPLYINQVNATACAVPRILIALLESNQQKVRVPRTPKGPRPDVGGRG